MAKAGTVLWTPDTGIVRPEAGTRITLTEQPSGIPLMSYNYIRCAGRDYEDHAQASDRAAMTLSNRLLRLMQTFTILGWKEQPSADGTSYLVHELMPFRLNTPQRMVWSRVATHLDAGKRMWAIVLKARREGVSTLTQSLIFAFGFLRGNGETLTLAHDGESSRAIFEIQRRIWVNMPLAKLSDPPQKEIRIASPSGWIVHRVTTAGAEAKGRGTSPIAEHLSEVAFWPFPETMTAVINAMPAIPTFQDLVVIESTANGKSGRGELFYEEWKMAEQGVSNKIPIFLSCLDMPDYRIPGGTIEDELDEDERELRDKYGARPDQLAWYRFVLHDQCRSDPMLRRQEYPSSPEQAFISSGLPAFAPEHLARQRVNLRKPDRICTVLSNGRLLDRPDGELSIWRHPDGSWPSTRHRYVCGSDSAPGGVFEGVGARRGDSRSWTADVIIDVETGCQVGEWYGPQVGRMHASILSTLVKQVFPHALAAIEVNSEGGRIMQADLRERFQYAALHPWKGKRDRVKPGAPHVWGWETNSYSRPMLLDNAQYCLAVDTVTIRSERLLSQLSDLTKSDTGRYEAEVGRDDLAIAWMIALESWQENFRGKQFGAARRDDDNVEFRLKAMGLKVVKDVDGALSDHVRKVMQGGRRSTPGETVRRKWGIR